MAAPGMMHVLATMAQTLTHIAGEMEWAAKNLAALDIPHARDRATELHGAAQQVRQWADEIVL